MDDYSAKNAGDVTFSELHASAAADMDGDGIPDFIVGKRYSLDSYTDQDIHGPPVLYVYKTGTASRTTSSASDSGRIWMITSIRIPTGRRFFIGTRRSAIPRRRAVRNLCRN